MQDQLGDQSCVFRPVRSTSSRNFAAPDENMELTKSSILGGLGKPGDTDSACRGLQEATCWRAMLFDRAF